jgi:histone H3
MQRTTHSLLDPDAFDLLVRQISAEFKTDLTFNVDALEALQTACEDYLILYFENTNSANLTRSDQDSMVQTKHSEIVKRIKGRDF